MKILILANNSIGLYSFRYDLISELCKENEVFLSTPDNGFFDELSQSGAKVIETQIDRRGVNPVRDLALLKTYRRMLKQLKPDMVITYTVKPNVYGGFLCRMTGIPYAVNITGLGTTFQSDNLLRKIVVKMYKIGLKKAKIVFFENVENRDILVKERVVKEENTCVLNGAGVNLKKFGFAKYPDERDETRFLFVGRIMKEKGIEELFSAVKKLFDEGYNVKLDLLGMAEENYDGIIRRYEDEGWLKNHGFQSDVKPFIENCDCFVLPSWHEGMANTNLECGAMGRPVITSNIHGCLEAVIDGVTGYLAEPRNADDLYEKLKQFIELPYDKKVEMGQNSHNHIAKNFDKKTVVGKTVEKLYSL